MYSYYVLYSMYILQVYNKKLYHICESSDAVFRSIFRESLTMLSVLLTIIINKIRKLSIKLNSYYIIYCTICPNFSLLQTHLTSRNSSIYIHISLT